MTFGLTLTAVRLAMIWLVAVVVYWIWGDQSAVVELAPLANVALSISLDLEELEHPKDKNPNRYRLAKPVDPFFSPAPAEAKFTAVCWPALAPARGSEGGCL